MLEGRGDEHRSVENACQRFVQYLEVSITPHIDCRPTAGQQSNPPTSG